MNEKHLRAASSAMSRFLAGHGLPLLVLFALLSISCANTRVVTEDLPVSIDRGPPKSDPVPVYEIGLTNPPRALVPFAQMGAYGVQQSTRDSLKLALARKASQMGADAVWVSGQQLTGGPTVTSYGNGLAVSEQTQFLNMFGQACMFSPVRLGVLLDKDEKVIDVVPDGAAARAGWKIGDRLLSIGGNRVTGNPLGFYQTTAAARPGQSLEAELVAPDNTTRKTTIVCDRND